MLKPLAPCYSNIIPLLQSQELRNKISDQQPPQIQTWPLLLKPTLRTKTKREVDTIAPSYRVVEDLYRPHHATFLVDRKTTMIQRRSMVLVMINLNATTTTNNNMSDLGENGTWHFEVLELV
ncbi:hypothetical protein CFOL_v3_13679 [Cephalotus follicularis]|uniref:Uncharacterized protein n=1 Tax=Cephalotus follicularis TaxID=3775 RepID=A0A1Q3BQ84_CEPFO|nr:hypothetical protein CFOL_v3_13679 [Cephalotus follicularis]